MTASFKARDGLLIALALACAGFFMPAPGLAQTAPTAPDPPANRPTALEPLPPAVIDNSLTVGGADIAARKIESRMTVAVRIEGHGPYRFVVDSGADTSVVGTNVARALKLPATDPARLHGMTANALVDRVTVAALQVGDSTISDLQLPVLREDDLGGQGIIGIDALVEQRLMMDFEKRLITIEDARRPAIRSFGDIVVVARRRRGQLILTQASANGRAVDAVIDTGSEITIGNMALRHKLFGRHGQEVQTGDVVDVTGTLMKLPLVYLDELRIGPILLRNVVIAFADVPPFAAFGLNEHPALFLGTDMMENFRRVSLDFRARKVRFQLKRCKPTGFSLRTYGSLSRLSSTDAAANACIE
ncbi:MAG: Retroviral aspartyl protease [Sphingomonas bacterium]|uniref:aspartyl protease family protein n=1 Tax=Sphingomonas bacterium TaxID=1895847 RepID=UPI0026132EAE|nr:aspartyl protease family protein [Sphingomonas bacterium]MDB5709389.1 Retroviral aspartyl protease [Sphingomonas bacterium]